MTRCLVGQILLDPAWGPQGLSDDALFSARDDHDRWIVWCKCGGLLRGAPVSGPSVCCSASNLFSTYRELRGTGQVSMLNIQSPVGVPLPHPRRSGE